MPDVCLACMPFAAVERPSIALGILHAILENAGVACISLYANIRYAEQFGTVEYAFWERAMGDMVFSAAAFPEFQPELAPYLRKTYQRLRSEAADAGLEDFSAFLEKAQRMRSQAFAFTDHMAHAALQTGARVVGCTSMYWQHTAALAFLRRVKDLDSSAVTLLGGANCEGVMGIATHRNFPWVDYVISGEADDFIGDFCKTILTEGYRLKPERIPFGVFGPVHRTFVYPVSNGGAPRATCKSIAGLPTPNYEDYFRTLRDSALAPLVDPGLLIETARGCWYGQLHHCKFCGISDSGMAYNSKPPERVLAEFEDMENRYGVSSFEVTDNIMDMSYFRTVLPGLAGARRRRIFWETKANLKRAHVEALSDAGIKWIQPGIESLDSRALKLMDKGVQASQNVQLLKWCRELGVRISWNILWGFPGEDDAWYAEMAALVERLHHLQPPRLILRLRHDRYSVYQANPNQYGLTLQPLPFMFLTYPLPEREITELTYYFAEAARDGKRPETISARPGVAELYRGVRRWQKAFWRGLPPTLSYVDDGKRMQVLDSRACAEEPRFEVQGLARAICLVCDEAIGVSHLRDRLLSAFGLEPGAAELERAIVQLEERRLVLQLDGRLLALANRGAVASLPSAREFPGGYARPVRYTAADLTSMRGYARSVSPELQPATK